MQHLSHEELVALVMHLLKRVEDLEDENVGTTNCIYELENTLDMVIQQCMKN